MSFQNFEIKTKLKHVKSRYQCTLLRKVGNLLDAHEGCK